MNASQLPTPIHDREQRILAPYAMHSRDTAGRRYAEAPHPYRGPYQRDRDRIVHSAAFRRLSGKMQVFTGDRGDYHRTRLTHTMEVASIARTIGRTLRLNEDLIEALALMHDIGHPPFGHAGEDALHDCLVNDGGFSHNQFALTLMEDLESRYHAFPGLNLSAEVLDGQRMRVDKSAADRRPLLEVQVVDVADSITYNAHDVDDALKLELVDLDSMLEIPLAGRCARAMHDRYGDLPISMMRPALVHELIDVQVSSVLRYCQPLLENSAWKNVQQARDSGFLIGPGPEIIDEKAELQEFLYRHVYRHPELLKVRSVAQCQLRELFDRYVAQPDRLPAEFQQRAVRVGIARGVADYLAGMTDRFCQQQFRRLLS